MSSLPPQDGAQPTAPTAPSEPQPRPQQIADPGPLVPPPAPETASTAPTDPMAPTKEFGAAQQPQQPQPQHAAPVVSTTERPVSPTAPDSLVAYDANVENKNPVSSQRALPVQKRLKLGEDNTLEGDELLAEAAEIMTSTVDPSNANTAAAHVSPPAAAATAATITASVPVPPPAAVPAWLLPLPPPLSQFQPLPR